MAERPAREPSGSADVDLAAVEAAVGRALVDRDESGLRVLGYGEISTVVGWPTERPLFACKRLPVFASKADADAYRALFTRYVDLLVTRGVDVVPSEFATTATAPDADPSGPVAAYVTQPVLDPATLGPRVLRQASPDPDHPLVAGIISATLSVTDDRTGFDAQVSNWACDDGRITYLDVTTPLLFEPDGAALMDTAIFLAALPRMLRGPAGRFVVPGVISSYRDPRKVLVDMAANLLKERLDHWIPAVLEAVNDHVDTAITLEEVTRYYRSDARLWEAMLRLRRADRWWQHRVRRRPYPFLLPGPITR